MANKKKILYVQTSGVDTPKRLYSPFVLGMTAQAMDIDATIYFLGLIMNQALQAGVKFMVCEQSTQLLRFERGEFIPEAEIVGAATLNDLVLDADATMWF
jgi:predicted peroxiredoxin